MTKESIYYLNFLAKTYDGVTKLIAATKQRLQSLPGEEREEKFDSLLKGQSKVDGLETIKGRIARELTKELYGWDIWELWLKKIPGIGPWIGAKLIMLFYYRFLPICKHCGGLLEKTGKQENENGNGKGTLICVDCGKKATSDGLLKYRLEYKDFPTISKWWAYMGRHTVDGIMPKRKKGQLSNWSSEGRTIGFHVGESFNKQNDEHEYKKFLLEMKAKHIAKNKEWKKGHIHNAAKNEAVKLFLSHFWTVARTMDNKPISEPYAGVIMGHTNVINPFYWESYDQSETQGDRASQGNLETQLGHASQCVPGTHCERASQQVFETHE